MDKKAVPSCNVSPSPQTLIPLETRRENAKNALNERFDALNKLWQTAEAEFKELPLPVNAYVPIDNDFDEHGQPTCEYLLGFAKSKGGWRICYGVSDFFGDSDTIWTPIGECALDIRVSAASHLPQLRVQVVEMAEKSVSKLDQAIAQLKGALASA